MWIPDAAFLAHCPFSLSCFLHIRFLVLKVDLFLESHLLHIFPLVLQIRQHRILPQNHPSLPTYAFVPTSPKALHYFPFQTAQIVSPLIRLTFMSLPVYHFSCVIHTLTERLALSVTASVVVTEVTVLFFLTCYRYEQQKAVHVSKSLQFRDLAGKEQRENRISSSLIENETQRKAM